jgi:hypothetical protein
MRGLGVASERGLILPYYWLLTTEYWLLSLAESIAED